MRISAPPVGARTHYVHELVRKLFLKSAFLQHSDREASILLCALLTRYGVSGTSGDTCTPWRSTCLKCSITRSAQALIMHLCSACCTCPLSVGKQRCFRSFRVCPPISKNNTYELMTLLSTLTASNWGCFSTRRKCCVSRMCVCLVPTMLFLTERNY